MTFRRRFILLFFLVSLVPIGLIQVYTFFFYVPSISAKIRALISYNLQQKGENLRLLVKQDVDIIYHIAGDPTVADSIRALESEDPGTIALHESRLIEAFAQFSHFHDSLAGIGYLGKNDRLVEYDKYLMVRDASSLDRFFSLSKMKQIVDQKGGLQFFPTTVFRDRADLPRDMFLIAFPYVDVAFRAKNGYLLLLLKEESIREILNPSQSDKTGILTRSFLFDESGRLYSAPSDGLLRAQSPAAGNWPDLEALAQTLPEFGGRPVNSTSLPGPFPGWILGTVYDESSVFADRNLISTYTVLLGLFFLLFSGLVTLLASRRLFRSFSILMESLRVDESRLNLQVETPSSDEIEILGSSWSKMKSRITELISEVNERNSTLLSVAEERRLAEIRALEAQVNPHFLYNTLNTLNWIAIKGGRGVLSQALSDLAEIMRYSISQIDVLASLAEEQAWLEKYLSLQRLRFGKTLEYRIDSQRAPAGFRLYKLLFQPFVENALVHGFDLNQETCLLEIVFESIEGGGLRATIRDNGKGFELEKTRSRILESSIGILNVERRLKSYYDSAAVLTYTSSPGKGTLVVLQIPEVRL